MPQRPARIVPAWRAMLVDAGRLAATLARARGDEGAAQRLPGHAEAMVGDAVELAGAVALAGDRLARRLPGYGFASTQVRHAETALLEELARRLAEAAGPDPGGHPALGGGPTGANGTARPDPRARLLGELLGASLSSDVDQGRRALHVRTLRAMVPDEARILAALSDGTRFALVHVETRGPGAVRLLADACTVGRAAGVHLSAAVPVYVTHLRMLGLAEEGPADSGMADQYALLASEEHVRRAEAAGQGGLGTRLVRRTLRLSPLGAELWAACHPDRPGADHAGPDRPAPDRPGTELEPGSTAYRSAYAGPGPVR